MVKNKKPYNNIKNISKSKKYDDKKLQKQRCKNKEKIEQLKKVKNVSRKSRLIKERDPYNYHRYGIYPETLMNIGSKVRVGGKGSQRRKRFKPPSYILYTEEKEKVKPIKLKPLVKCKKGECVICFERTRMDHENTLDCNGVKHPLCSGCQGKMKKNVCPLCNSHPIGLKITKYSSDRFYYNDNDNDNDDDYVFTSFQQILLGAYQYHTNSQQLQ
jgi:hypothetical protein